MPVSVYSHRVHAFFSFYDAVLHVCKHLKVRLQMYRYGEAHTPCLEQGVGPSPWTHCWWNLLLMRDRTYRLCRRLTVPVALLARCGGEGSVSCILWKARTCTLGASCSHVFSCRTTMRWRWGIKVKWWFWGYSGKKMYAFQTCPDCTQFWLVFNHCIPIVYPLYTLVFFPAASAPSFLVQSTVTAWHCLVHIRTMSWGLVAYSCMAGSETTLMGHWGWAALRGREYLWEIYSPT